jgi:hypothetical protein
VFTEMSRPFAAAEMRGVFPCGGDGMAKQRVRGCRRQLARANEMGVDCPEIFDLELNRIQSRHTDEKEAIFLLAAE